jgi:hypothetical protein
MNMNKIKPGDTFAELPSRRSQTAVKSMIDNAEPGMWVAVRVGVSWSLVSSYRKAAWNDGDYEFANRKVNGQVTLFGRRTRSEPSPVETY